MADPTSRDSRLLHPVTDADHILGPPDAPIRVVKYGMYVCPTSRAAHDIIQTLRGRFGPDRLCFVYRHFPLVSLFPNARIAAEAAEAAGKQHKFWEMHAALMEHRSTLDDGDIVGIAACLGLDVMGFLRDLSAHVHASRVRRDFQFGTRNHVTMTPTFFFNEIRYSGALTVEAFTQSIEETLDDNGKK